MVVRAGPSHPLFKTRPNQVQEIRKMFGFNDEKSLNDAIDVLQAWARQQNHFVVKEFPRDYLEAYVITSKGSLEKAKKRLDKRCTLRRLMPELFDNINVKTDFQTLFKTLKHAIMPMPTKDYYRVLIDVFAGNIETYNLIDYVRYTIVVSALISNISIIITI